MSKIKSHSGTKDRVKITKNGKVLARKDSRNHNLQKKSASRKRTYAVPKEIVGTIKKNIKRSLGV
jgi:ribosomal protein L35